MTEALKISFGTVLGQLSPAGSSAAMTPLDSVLDYLTKGGLMMIPIGLCSLVVLTVVIERLVSLRRSRIIPGLLLSDVKQKLQNNDEGRSSALSYCSDDASPLARIIATGIRRLGEPIELLEKHIQDTGERVVQELRKSTRLLSVIAAISPLLGLLGTIFGMIAAFQTVAVSGEALGKTELLAQGIYQALITTAAGLLVAIPALLAYHWICAKVEKLVLEMDKIAVDFIEECAIPHQTQPVQTDSTQSPPADGNGRTYSSSATRGVETTA